MNRGAGSALLTLSNALDRLQIPPPMNPKTHMAGKRHPDSDHISGAEDGAKASDADESQPLILRRESMDRFSMSPITN